VPEPTPTSAWRGGIVAGAHLRISGGYPRSTAFLKEVEAMVVEAGLDLGTCYGGNPDEDVAFMSKATLFVGASRGFAGMVADLVSLRGGTVVKVVL